MNKYIKTLYYLKHKKQMHMNKYTIKKNALDIHV